MSRPCQICDTGLKKEVRAWAKDGLSPKKIREKLSREYHIDIEDYQLRYHTKKHDPIAGTNEIVRKAAEKAKADYEDKTEVLEQEIEKVTSLSDKMESALDVLLGTAQLITPEEMKSMSPFQKVRTAKMGIDAVLAAKKLENETRKMNSEMTFGINDMGKLIAKAATKKIKRG